MLLLLFEIGQELIVGVGELLDTLESQLVGYGLHVDAEVADVSQKGAGGAHVGAEGHARFRVRVGTFKSREEAAAAADRLRSARSLSVFVTLK